MANSKIIELFKSGNFPGAEKGTPKHIVTAISDVFVFPQKAYKIYKSDSEFFNKSFNDLSVKTNRFDFTQKDFVWNNKLSPEVYTELRGIVLKDEVIKFVEVDDHAEELLIVMNTIDMSDVLINKLISNSVSLKDCYSIGFQLGERTKKIPKRKTDLTAYEDFIAHHIDMIAWVGGVSKYIPNEEASIYLARLKKYIEDFSIKLKGEDKGLIGPCFDIHADNAIYKNGVFMPIDSYSPKEAWLIGYKYLNVYRVATDIYAFLGQKYFEEVFRGYQKSTGDKIPRIYDDMVILFCELIVCPYQYMLAETDQSRLAVAEKYRKFLQKIGK